MTVRAVALLGLVALPACFSKPPAPLADDAQPSDGGGGSDAEVRDASADAIPDTPSDSFRCVIDDMFTSTSPVCGDWGTQFGNTVDRDGSRLRTKPPANVEAGCVTELLRASGMFSIHLDQLGLTVLGDYVFYELIWPSVTEVTMRVERIAAGDRLTVTCGAVESYSTYSANAHRYLRYVMTPSGSNIDINVVGFDGVSTYTSLGSCTVINVAARAAYVRFGTGSSNLATNAETYWDNLTFQCN